jgi:hypothetical protein
MADAFKMELKTNCFFISTFNFLIFRTENDYNVVIQTLNVIAKKKIFFTVSFVFDWNTAKNTQFSNEIREEGVWIKCMGLYWILSIPTPQKFLV